MSTTLVGLHGPLTGKRFAIGNTPVTFGRGDDNVVILTSALASRVHAELRREADSYVLYDRGSRNGTRVNGTLVTMHHLQPGDQIIFGDETFRFEMSDAPATIPTTTTCATSASPASHPILRVTVTGGGPVGLTLALLLDHLLGPRVAIKVYDSRWMLDGTQVVWKTAAQGNVRRQQVVTIQSRQYLNLPPEFQERLFSPGTYSEMWPAGPDSIYGLGPRNVRIAYIEDQLLALANERANRIQLIPATFDPDTDHADLIGQHVLAICEGGRSRTRDYFAAPFGTADTSMYSLDGQQVQDVVLGLRVKSDLPDPMAVLLTVAQNRFLLNSLYGEGFLNMRLTDQEAKEAVGIDPIRQVFEDCIQARPCLMERTASDQFCCATHNTLFLPALLKRSALWQRVLEGLQLFGISEQNLSAVTAFRLDMVQRPRFTAQVYPATATTPGTFACLLGDAANAIHFWPGRGLNSGLASAISLARCLAAQWRGTDLRDADFVRHEGVMAMLQYRHKSRAWRSMVTTDATGKVCAIKDKIAQGIVEGEQGTYEKEADIRALLERLGQIRSRLASRLSGLPDDTTLRAHLEQLTGPTLHALVVSGAWDTVNVGGEEVDVEWLFAAQEVPMGHEAEPLRVVERMVPAERQEPARVTA